MTLIRRIFFGQLPAAVTLLSFGYAWSGQPLASIIFILLGLLWFAGEKRGLTALANIILFLFVAAAAFGYQQGLAGGALLGAVVFSLGAWDLTHFLVRLKAAERVDFETGLGREHLRRLGLVQGLGLVAGLLALTSRARIPFWWEVLLAFLVIIGISRLVVLMRKQSGDE